MKINTIDDATFSGRINRLFVALLTSSQVRAESRLLDSERDEGKRVGKKLTQ